MLTSLRNQRHFDVVSSVGRAHHHSNFVYVVSGIPNELLHLVDTSSTSAVVLGMKVTKKLGNAPTRNKIKRRIRHLHRLLIQQSKKPLNLCVIFIPKKGFENVNFMELFSVIQLFIRKTKVDITHKLRLHN
ncbi:MAG: ribonuclease P protein component [Rickettsiaceae bacterium]